MEAIEAARAIKVGMTEQGLEVRVFYRTEWISDWFGVTTNRDHEVPMGYGPKRPWYRLTVEHQGRRIDVHAGADDVNEAFTRAAAATLVRMFGHSDPERSDEMTLRLGIKHDGDDRISGTKPRHRVVTTTVARRLAQPCTSPTWT